MPQRLSWQALSESVWKCLHTPHPVNHQHLLDFLL